MDAASVRRASRSADENAAAYGEIVWSWRRDPGATPAGAIPPATGARKAASPGRARISRQTIARGRPGCLGCTCLIRVRSLLPIAHGAAGAVGARPSLRPLSKREQAKMQNSGNTEPRERERLSPRHCERSEAIQLPSATRKLDCFRLRSPSFDGLPARRSLRSKRRRVVAVAPRNDGILHLAPLAGRGRRALARRVRGTLGESDARRQPLTPTPRNNGERGKRVHA